MSIRSRDLLAMDLLRTEISLVTALTAVCSLAALKVALFDVGLYLPTWKNIVSSENVRTELAKMRVSNDI